MINPSLSEMNQQSGWWKAGERVRERERNAERQKEFSRLGKSPSDAAGALERKNMQN